MITGVWVQNYKTREFRFELNSEFNHCVCDFRSFLKEIIINIIRMVIITNQNLIQEYCISSYRLIYIKETSRRSSAFIKVDTGITFVLGSAVDCILTAEEGEFERQYYVLMLKTSDV
jgi:hypothetical protein